MSQKRYRSWAPNQAYLLPPSPGDWLGEGHLAYFILEVVEELDLSEIADAIHAKDPRGNRPYPPQMMVGLLLYAYAVGTFSSRKIARGTYDNLAMRYLAADSHPYFTTIAAFRREHLTALSKLFVQAVKLCQAAGLVKLGHVSLDGTKIQANASKHKAMSYDRMTKKEKQLEAEIEALLKRAEETDTAEDVVQGEDTDEDSLPEELRRREIRLEKIREAKQALQQEAKAARGATLREQQARHEETATSHSDATTRKRAATNAAKRASAAEALEESKDNDDDGPPGGAPDSDMPRHQTKAEPDGTPKPKSQRNFTDPESRIMKGKSGAFEQAYNVQIGVDDENQIIVGLGVSNHPADTDHLIPVLKHGVETTGGTPDVATADAGYWSPENAEWCENEGIDAFISVGRERCEHKPSEPTEALPPDGLPPDGTAPDGRKASSPDTPRPRDLMATKLKTERGKKIYRKRKYIPEPVFGQIKEARGFRRFSLRGLEAVRGEWALVCTTHNLLKLFRASTGGKLMLPKAA